MYRLQGTIKYIIPILLLLCCCIGQAQQPIGINKVSLGIPDSSSYSYYVSAHFYGGNQNVSGYPASTILGNVDLLNAASNSFTICSGDLFKDIRGQWKLYDTTFFNKLTKPLFNAVGNHDVTDDLFETHYGPTSYYFQIGKDIHVVLNTEADDGSIKGEQLKMLKKAMSISGVSNILIYSHRPIWAEATKEFDDIFKGNTVSTFGINFNSEVAPLLESLNKDINLYWFSGSLGGGAVASFFYHEKDNLHYIQSAIRDLKRDALLQVKSNNGNISFETVSLTGETLKELESYNLDAWRDKHPVKEFNYRLVPFYIKSMLTHRFFWYGIIYMFLGVIFILFIKKIRNRRKRV
ncbi:MAG: hypothetical protein ACI9J3_000081 [Parvicellaceae bacterium]|jgi:hypothetical protein